MQAEKVIATEIMRGNYNFGKSQCKKKLFELVEYYLKYSEINKKSYENDVISTNMFKTYWGDIPIENITSSDIELFKEYLKNERKIKNSTINRYMHNLSRMLNIA
ncbi:MAG: phage integrase SAM-like domain-containing protein, partial [Candidatus Gastranaerophilales bacterium]|nr:phage integrase SAM-like domain-containing protein [Candidatus Gastranaerophilales bacterium]